MPWACFQNPIFFVEGCFLSFQIFLTFYISPKIITSFLMKKILTILLLLSAFAFSADLVVEGKLTEVPGKMPTNDLYSYVYMFKYKVIKVVSGDLKKKEVLVGVYNPLIARGQVKDKMMAKAKGNVRSFKAGDKHTLKLIPLEGNWDGAIEDEYFDDESERYLAIEVNQ